MTVSQAINRVSNVALYMGTEASIGYFCARFFTKVNPLHSAALSASSCLLSAIVKSVLGNLFSNAEFSPQTKFVGALAIHGLSIIATAGLASLAGCPLTLTTASALACYSIGMHLLLAATNPLATSKNPQPHLLGPLCKV